VERVESFKFLGVHYITAHYITGAKLPAIKDLYTRRVRGKPPKLSKTPVTQVIDCFLCYHTHGKRYRCP
jgi:hypothetical protein